MFVYIINYKYNSLNIMGYVYLIYDPNNETYKIGVTRSNNSKRIKALQTGNATKLQLLNIYECEYPFRLESMMHKKFENKRVLNEWFQLTKEEVNNFICTCEQFDQSIHCLKTNPFFSKNLK